MSTSPEEPRRRTTRQQLAVADELGRHNDFCSAQELHARLRERGTRVGLATVYRVLTVMAADGEVDVLRTDEGEARYRRCSTGHHHHLVCRDCGRTVEVAGPGVETWSERVAAEHGFVDVDHTLELFGTCSGCAGPGPGTARTEASG
ncbi:MULTISPECIES: Fur family transcriptional regulator [Ornithinimicrobium]|uniref:Fur family transcriptional regulator n=1 Tax=Ornithinimicrobium kibberense TaxID=282060 RepID=A0ABV5UYP4_9MICO|nr:MULTISPECIES: transcriptional repressor [Ornithinimicrobium]OLT20925.1 transcriptional repressor [Ornithinimicrobium sp. CNJ-824]